MLGRSRHIKWSLCACRNCVGHSRRGNKDYKRMLKRRMRKWEHKLWRKEQT